LPTEAEWEYAARARTRTSRYWGDNPDDACQYANVYDQTSERVKKDPARKVHNCDDGYAMTAPVSSFQPNDFGLYDMLGNVWEWCADSWHDSYQGAPVDGSVWERSGGSNRVLRGGSWVDEPGFVRSRDRFKAAPTHRDYSIGFRLVRTE
jgi:sulfatase modifying factor 1